MGMGSGRTKHGDPGRTGRGPQNLALLGGAHKTGVQSRVRGFQGVGEAEGLLTDIQLTSSSRVEMPVPSSLR